MSLGAMTDLGQNTSRKQQLAADLRTSASGIADRAGGGLALIFVAAPENGSPENTTRLRAAAGFPVAETARDAAQALMATIREVITTGTEQQLGALPSLEERSNGGLLIVPMNLENQCHGALAVGAPASIQADLREFIEREASKLGLLLDHARICEELETAKKELAGLREIEGSADNSHEVLELSEGVDHLGPDRRERIALRQLQGEPESRAR
jgi:uncharacterized protein (DUF2267 family)